jgi:hypothetical protein
MNLTAFFGCEISEMLVRGEDIGDDINEVGADADRLCGRKRDMRNFMAANERGD